MLWISNRHNKKQTSQNRENDKASTERKKGHGPRPRREETRGDGRQKTGAPAIPPVQSRELTGKPAFLNDAVTGGPGEHDPRRTDVEKGAKAPRQKRERKREPAKHTKQSSKPDNKGNKSPSTVRIGTIDNPMVNIASARKN